MIFDTAAGELSPQLFEAEVVPQLTALAHTNPARTGYYSKGTQPAHLRDGFTRSEFLGIGVDHTWDLREAFEISSHGFVQGNFDQALLHAPADELKKHLSKYLAPLQGRDWPGWICGLGHGVLPATPEDNVRLFVDTVREVMQ